MTRPPRATPSHKRPSSLDILSGRLTEGRLYLHIQWHLGITKDERTGKIYSLKRGFVISKFFFIYFTITGVKKIFRYIEDVVI